MEWTGMEYGKELNMKRNANGLWNGMEWSGMEQNGMEYGK